MNIYDIQKKAERLRERVFALSCATYPLGRVGDVEELYDKTYFDAISLCDDIDLLLEAKDWLLTFTYAGKRVTW